MRRPTGEAAVFLPISNDVSNHAPSSPPVVSTTSHSSPSPSPSSPLISSPVAAAVAAGQVTPRSAVSSSSPSAAALQHRQSWSPRRPNYEPPPPPKKSAADGPNDGAAGRGRENDYGVTPPVRGASLLARSQSMKETTPTKATSESVKDDVMSDYNDKLTVALPPAAKGVPIDGAAKLTPTRMAPPEPGYEAVAPFRKTSIEGNDYYVADNGATGGHSDHVYEEPIWPAPRDKRAAKTGNNNKKQRPVVGNQECLKEEEEEEEDEVAVGAVGGAPLTSSACKDARGYNKPVHPGSKHISSEQLNRLCDSFDDDDDDNDVNRNNDEDDDEDAGYSRPLLQGSRARLYDDAADAVNGDSDAGDHNYDEPYVETPQFPTNDAVDKL